jgi:hypothetical protein
MESAPTRREYMEPKVRTIETTLLRSHGRDESSDTHRSNWFHEVWRYVPKNNLLPVIDPFARDCKLADITNDLNPDTSATHHLDCLEFLQSFELDDVDGCIFDPPFSVRMAKDHYDGFGVDLYCSDQAKMSQCMKELARIIRPGGWLLKFAFNCNRPHPAFELERLWLVNKGGFRNDISVSLWRHTQRSLKDWLE